MNELDDKPTSSQFLSDEEVEKASMGCQVGEEIAGAAELRYKQQADKDRLAAEARERAI